MSRYGLVCLNGCGVCKAVVSECEYRRTGEPVKLVPYEPTSEMLIAAREIDPALPIEHVRRLWWLLWRAAPQAALGAPALLAAP